MTDIEKKEQRYNVRLIATQDDTPVRGNAIDSGDDEFDRKVEDEILERLDNGDVWAWANVEVKVILPDGRTGSAYLGGSYEDEADFKRGGYYEEMLDEAIEAAESQHAPDKADEQRKLIEDLLSFVVHTSRRTDIDANKQLALLYATLIHDLSGALADDPFFCPRVDGYSDKFPLI